MIEVLLFLPNVKEHAPPPLKSEGAATEKLHGGCCVSSCSASSIDVQGDGLEEGFFDLMQAVNRYAELHPSHKIRVKVSSEMK